MKFIVSGIIKQITLKVWSNETETLCYQWEDIFESVSLEMIRIDPAFVWSDEDRAWICSESAYDKLVEYWREETSKYNLREPSWFTDGMDAEEFLEEINLDLEMLLDYD